MKYISTNTFQLECSVLEFSFTFFLSRWSSISISVSWTCFRASSGSADRTAREFRTTGQDSWSVRGLASAWASLRPRSLCSWSPTSSLSSTSAACRTSPKPSARTGPPPPPPNWNVKTKSKSMSSHGSLVDNWEDWQKIGRGFESRMEYWMEYKLRYYTNEMKRGSQIRQL